MKKFTEQDIKKIKKKYNGIIPIGKVNMATWLEHDIRSKKSKALALYKYGKTKDFISKTLGLSVK